MTLEIIFFPCFNFEKNVPLQPASSIHKTGIYAFRLIVPNAMCGVSSRTHNITLRQLHLDFFSLLSLKH